MRRGPDGEAPAGARAHPDRALGRGRRGEPRHAGNGPDERDERGQVVRAHVQERPGAVLEELLGTRMPRVRSAHQHRGAHRHRLPDRPLVDQRARRLIGPAEKDVRRAAERESAARRLRDQLRRLGRRRRQGLLAVDVLARLERAAGHRDVRPGRRQVQHRVERRICDQLVDRERLQPVIRRERARERRLEVGAGDELERIEGGGVLRVVLGDDSAADDPDLHTISRTAASDRSAASSAGPSVSSCSTSSHSTPASTAAGRTRS